MTALIRDTPIPVEERTTKRLRELSVSLPSRLRRWKQQHNEAVREMRPEWWLKRDRRCIRETEEYLHEVNLELLRREDATPASDV